MQFVLAKVESVSVANLDDAVVKRYRAMNEIGKHIARLGGAYKPTFGIFFHHPAYAGRVVGLEMLNDEIIGSVTLGECTVKIFAPVIGLALVDSVNECDFVI